VLDEMHRRGVATRRGLMACHLEACYRGARIAGSLRHTEAATDQTMILPMYADLAEDDQARVVDALRAVLPA
jgi:dTDP-4-amino-4,6-dideoxygalactose transaminase